MQRYVTITVKIVNFGEVGTARFGRWRRAI